MACSNSIPSKLDNSTAGVHEITTLAEAHSAALRYMREHKIEGSLSDGSKSKLGGWHFLVLFDDLVVGHHLFLRVLPDGTIIEKAGA
jgi:hypothetical protein